MNTKFRRFASAFLLALLITALAASAVSAQITTTITLPSYDPQDVVDVGNSFVTWVFPMLLVMVAVTFGVFLVRKIRQGMRAAMGR